MATPAEHLADQVQAALAEYHRRTAETEAQRVDIHPALLRLHQAAKARRAWKRIDAEIPQIIADACSVDMWGPQDAALCLGVTESYVYRKLREHRAAQ